VAVYSEPGCGACFKIYLPRERDGRVGDAAATKTESDGQGSETILLVEDEDGVRSLAKRVLEGHGYQVLEARHGREALSLGEQLQVRIDLLATDVVLPQMSGRELAERLTPLRPHMKVLYLSGYMDDAIVRHGLLHAEVPFLQKPYTPETLAQKIREVLDRPRA
jgi:CheY-like chemotaxis protein